MHLELEIPATPATVTSARAAITTLCERLDLDDDVTERVRIAVNEACTNCVQHAYNHEGTGSTYMLESRVEDDALLVVVHDCGIGMAHQSQNKGLGLGLRMIQDLADGTRVSSRPGYGTRIAMWFAVRATS